MKSNYSKVWVLLACFMSVIACTKKPTDYRSFLGGREVTYPGVVQNPIAFPGNGRLMLAWSPSPDPSVSRYVVYWNNYADSLVVQADTHYPADTVRCLITGLQEYNYTFFVKSFDKDGNKSITTEIDNAKVYGSIYQSNLLNRPVNMDNPFVVNSDGSVTLYFNTPDTINIATDIKYTNAAGVLSQSSIASNSSSITLPSYKSGAPVVYRSSYIPVHGAIDTFNVSQYDTFPPIFNLVQCDKSLFSEMNQPSDMHPYQTDTRVSVLWNGSVGPQGYPNIFHSDGANPLPGTISFDMGKVYNDLAIIEETGRNCCHNPIDFEVWGIADTTNAFPALPSNDPGWKAETITKGWTLLTEAFRSDDGQAAKKFNFISNPPPVRYIRVRFIKTTDDPSYVNLSQLTFWNKQ